MHAAQLVLFIPLSSVVMLLVCVLGVGFMIRFLIALVADGKRPRAGYQVQVESMEPIHQSHVQEQDELWAAPVAYVPGRLMRPAGDSGGGFGLGTLRTRRLSSARPDARRV